MLTGRRGFTLIELMVVVAVIAILMAMAIPILINARMAANEGSAVSSLRSITSANQTYRTRFSSYPSVLTDLSDAGFIDSVLGNAGSAPGKSGYIFTYLGGSNTWTVSASPVSPGASGIRYFFVDESGIIRFAENGAATSASQPID